MRKDTDSCRKKLGQILVRDGKVKKSDVQKALSLQPACTYPPERRSRAGSGRKDNPEHQLLGVILIKMNLITKEELSTALNKQIESSVRRVQSGSNLSDNERIKMIADKYKETEYFDDLNELMGIVTHKVRNPLAGISAAVEVLRERAEKDDSNERLFKMIFKEIDRLDSIVKEFFATFSNKQ